MKSELSLAASRMMGVAVWVSVLAAAVPAEVTASGQPGEEGNMILENELLRVEVSPIGSRIVGLTDKVRNREDVKNLPYVGGLNEVRLGRTLGVNELRDTYALTMERGASGEQILTGTRAFERNEDEQTAGTVIKRYVLSPGSSSIRMSVEIRNEGEEEIGVIPWVRNLLLRPEGVHPEEAHMTEYGPFLSGRPLPGQRDGQPPRGDPHYFPSANWSSRVIGPGEQPGNLLAFVTRPEDMYKLYNWHRGVDFSTLEVIAQPFFAAPGGSFRWDYFMVWGPPVRNLVYASPELLVGVSPHPTWLPADTKELALDFAATHDVATLEANARLVAIDRTEKPVREYAFTLAKLSPRAITRHALPVELKEGAAYQLRLTFTLDGQPFVPGAAVGDVPEVIIPLVVGDHEDAPVVFRKQTEAVGRLRQIQPTERIPRRVYACDGFEAFAYHPASRVFQQDTFKPADDGPAVLQACAGSHESFQLVLVPKGKAETVLQVSATELSGPGSAKVTCESINEFIYVPTTTPSGYNANYPLGEYPEALLPVEQTTVKPEGNHPLFVTWRVPMEAEPGRYRGSVRLTQDGLSHEIPVEMTVWNIRIPVRSPYMEFASSLKGTTLPEARHADGTPYSREEQLETIENMHLKYRMTPCDSGLANLLLQGNYPAFETKMQRFVDAGATKIYLGNSRQLIERYGDRLPEIEAYLKDKGWIDYFYVRPGFDEVASDQVLKVKAVLEEWKKVSSVATMETYYHDDGAPELFGLLDIWSRSSISSLFDERIEAGDRFWKVNAMPGILEDEPWTTGRKRYIDMWDKGFTGSYTWTVKHWQGVAKWGEDYWNDHGVGNLSAVLMWPHETGILSTIRLEALRDGLEDNAMFWMLREKVKDLEGKAPEDPEQAAALEDARSLCSSGPLAPTIKSAEDLERLRVRVGEALSALNGLPE